jgi:GNAT superfamily N-acetyltransferase
VSLPVVVTNASSAERSEYARVPIAFDVRCVLDPEILARPGPPFSLRERPVDVPYIKDYDALDGGPMRWHERFDISTWGFFVARVAGTLVGGAAVAVDTKGELVLAEGRDDLAVLWDLRVSPAARGHGVGTALFRAAEVWATTRGCREMKVETQNINVPACRFYARQGCVLSEVRPGAYPNLPDEIALLWRKDFAQP